MCKVLASGGSPLRMEKLSGGQNTHRSLTCQKAMGHTASDTIINASTPFRFSGLQGQGWGQGWKAQLS